MILRQSDKVLKHQSRNVLRDKMLRIVAINMLFVAESRKNGGLQGGVNQAFAYIKNCHLLSNQFKHIFAMIGKLIRKYRIGQI